jgi:hypothetical protein
MGDLRCIPYSRHVPPLYRTAGHVESCKRVLVTGAARVGGESQLFWILSPQLICSCALNGWMGSSPV